MLERTNPAIIQGIISHLEGYGATFDAAGAQAPEITTNEYAQNQIDGNEQKTIDFLLPLLRQTNASVVLDLGCGVGSMVQTLLEHEYEAYGIDLIDQIRFWKKLSIPEGNFFFVDPLHLNLPFQNDSIDFAFSFGVIEHIGTDDGHAHRLPNYHEIRKQWIREVYRVVRPGGHMLIAGPNRNFPIDVAHGPDSKATRFENKISALTGMTIHKTWGENFLWGYKDFDRYLEGLKYSLKGLSPERFLSYSRVPGGLKKVADFYLKSLPESALSSGLNPWAMALIKKGE